MTTTSEIADISVAERERAIATIVTAFSADPVIRWAFPDSQQYLTYWPELVHRFAGKAFEDGTAYSVGPHHGVALWLRPGVDPDNAGMEEVMQRAVPEQDQERIFGFLSQMDEYHPDEPLWYLPVLGVDPTHQGQGLGSALLAHALSEVDKEGKAAYLEASSERNRDLYARHGFEVIGTIQFADSPPAFPMLRKPR